MMRSITPVVLLAATALLAPACARQNDVPDSTRAPHPTMQSSDDYRSSPQGRGMGSTASPHGRMGTMRSPAMEEIVPEVKKMVEDTVKDPNRAQQVERILESIVKEVRVSNQEMRGFHEQLNGLNANYDAKREQFQQIIKDLQDTRAQRAQKILDMRFQIRELMTAQEWKELTDRMLRLRERAEGYGS